MNRHRAVAGVVAGLASVLLTAGCTQGQRTDGQRAGGSALPQRTADPALVARAALTACPAVGADRASGLPDLTLPCLGTGPAVHLAGLRGPALVNVWASDCAPCRVEAPLLQALYADAHGRLTVLGVDADAQPDRGLGFATEAGLHYPSVVDEHEAINSRIALRGYPWTLGVDAAGNVTAHPGPFTSAADLHAWVRTALGVDVR